MTHISSPAKGILCAILISGPVKDHQVRKECRARRTVLHPTIFQLQCFILITVKFAANNPELICDNNTLCLIPVGVGNIRIRIDTDQASGGNILYE